MSSFFTFMKGIFLQLANSLMERRTSYMITVELLAQPSAWFIVAVIFFVFELFVPGNLFTALFSVASFITGIIAFFASSYWVQLSLFAILSLFLFVVIKPFLERSFKVNKLVKDSSINEIIGKVGTVNKSIDAKDTGRVLIGNEDWKARSINEESIEQNEKVIVEKIEGVTLFVSKKGSEKE